MVRLHPFFLITTNVKRFEKRDIKKPNHLFKEICSTTLGNPSGDGTKIFITQPNKQEKFILVSVDFYSINVR